MYYSKSAVVHFDWKQYGAYVTVDNYGILRVYSPEITLCGAVNELGEDVTARVGWIYSLQRTPIHATEEVIHMEPRR